MSKKIKLRNYTKIKNKLKFESYLHCNSNIRGRRYHFSLRNGSNSLEIERGRWKGISRENRLCNQCDSKVVEDEVHFLLICSRKESGILKIYLRIVLVNSYLKVLCGAKLVGEIPFSSSAPP